jgi:trimethylamine--corrinoid protein Co-methyltransferase
MCGVGLLEDSSCLFYEEIVIDNEIVGAIARLIRGELADDETMALDLIEKVGVGKNFLAQKHTINHLRAGEHFMPDLIDRRSFDAWSASGSKSLVDKARDKTKWILENHKVAPLDPATQKKVDAVIEKAKKPMWGGETKVA